MGNSLENIMGNRIHQKRIECGLTMEELGQRVGVGNSAVNKWEKGLVTNIKQTTIADMAKIFDCSPVWLMGFDTPEKLGKIEKIEDTAAAAKLAKDDFLLLSKFHKLSDRDKTIITSMIDSMLSQ